MATTAEEAYRPIKEAWQLYQAMTEDLARQRARTEFSGEAPSEAWNDLSARIESTKAALYGVAGPSDTPRDRRHNHHQRSEIAGLNETLDETYASLEKLADAELAYLRLEHETKEAMAHGSSGDLESLDMARSRVTRAGDSLRQYRANLALRIENLADDTGSGLFTPTEE